MLKMVQADKLDCYHCGLSVAAGENYCAELAGELCHFCCPSCRLVATTIHDSGLGNFYRFNDREGRAVDSSAVSEQFAGLDHPDFQQRYVHFYQQENQQRASVQLLIGGIHCAACVWLLENYLSAIPGVDSARVNLSEQVAYLHWQPETVSLSALCQAIARLGYQPQVYTPDQLALMQQQENHLALRRLGVAGIAMMQVGMYAIALYAGALQGIEDIYRDFLRWVSLIVATPVVFYAARPFFVGAWRGIKMKAPGMDLPVAIAIGLAYSASLHATLSQSGEVYFDSVAMFTFLLLAGRYLEMRARHRGAQLHSDLNSLLPTTVLRVNATGTEQESIPYFQLNIGDHVLVRPGQIIPVDGFVVSGCSSVSEAQLTGEFMPKTKAARDVVLAGSVNESDALVIYVTAIGSELKLQSINDLLKNARLSKPKLAQLADRYARYFVIAVLSIAAATGLYWQFIDGGQYSQQALWVMLSVLVVSCPCALSLATPAALTAATNRLRRSGLLVTNPEVWEQVAGITDVVCDKTGTLTRGELSIATILPVADLSADQCLQLAATIEHYSEHPIARAFANKTAAGQGSKSAEYLSTVSGVNIQQGQGVEAQVDGRHFRIGAARYVGALFTSSSEAELPVASMAGSNQTTLGHWVLLGSAAGPLCWFQLQDSLRDDAESFVQALKVNNLRLHLLSGDSSSEVEALAQRLAFDTFRAGAMPAEKLAYVKSLQQRGAKVMMLGDGLNDIPVLAAADISVAMANASDLAKTQADTISLSGQLMSVIQLLSLAQKTRRVIRQNLGWVLVYNALAIPLAMMALVPPYLAALGMSLSSLLVVFNALRLQKNKRSLPIDQAESQVPSKPVGSVQLG